MENYNLHRRAQSGWHPTSYSRKPMPDAPRERNWAALMEAAKRKPVGYWEDAPTGIKFGGGGNTEKASGLTKAKTPDTTQNATAPTPPQSADGPWPKWLIANTYLRRFDGPTGGCMVFYDSGDTGRDPYGGWDLWSDDPRVCTQSAALEWLEQNGHKDAAAQLRGKAAADDLYEPIGTMPVVGDTMRTHVGLDYPCTGIYEEDGRKYASMNTSKAWMNFKSFATGEYRILKRKPTPDAPRECVSAMGLDTVAVRVDIGHGAQVDCKTARAMRGTWVRIYANGLIIPCEENDPDRIGYVR